MLYSPPEILYDNRFEGPAVVASSTAAGYSAASMATWRTAEQWMSADASAQYLTVDCGAAAAADGVGLVSNLHLVGGSVAVECSSDNFSADITVTRAAAPVSSSVLFAAFASQNKRYWRLAITGLTAPAVVSLAAVGERFVFADGVFGEYDPAAEQVQAQNPQQRRGHGLAVVPAFKKISTQLQFEQIDDAWFRQSFMPVWNARIMRGLPFFIAHNRTLAPTDAAVMWLRRGAALDAQYEGTLRRFSLALEGVAL